MDNGQAAGRFGGGGDTASLVKPSAGSELWETSFVDSAIWNLPLVSILWTGVDLVWTLRYLSNTDLWKCKKCRQCRQCWRLTDRLQAAVCSMPYAVLKINHKRLEFKFPDRYTARILDRRILLALITIWNKCWTIEIKRSFQNTCQSHFHRL